MRKANKIEKTALILFGICITLLALEFSLRLAGSFSDNFDPAESKTQATSDKEAYRILCLGDSWTNDAGVDKADNYPAQLEEILNTGKPERIFKVYNLGFPNFNSTMVLRKFKNAYPALNPDAVVVMMGRSDQWNFTGMDSSNLQVFQKIKLMFLQSKIGELVSILRYNLQYKLRSLKRGGIAERKAAQGQVLSSFYELVAQGNRLRAKAKLKEASSVYKQAIEIVDDHPVALLELARCYKLQKEYDLAKSALLKIIRISPDNTNIYSELDDIFIQQQKPKKTVEFYKPLIIIYPENEFIRKRLIGAFIVLGDTLYGREYFEQAIDNYIQALSLDPDNEYIQEGLLYNLAILQKGTKKLKAKTKVRGHDSTIDQERQKCFSHNLIEFINICAKNNIQLIFSSYPREMSDLMKSYAHIYKIPLLDQRLSFTKIAKEKDISMYFSKDGHCSKEGYRIVAESIAQKINDLVLMK